MSACTFPRNDAKRPVCGREVVAWYVVNNERLGRCTVHDSDLARMVASELGVTRLPVVRSGDPLTVAA